MRGQAKVWCQSMNKTKTMKKRNRTFVLSLLSLALSLVLLLGGCGLSWLTVTNEMGKLEEWDEWEEWEEWEGQETQEEQENQQSFSLDSIPPYSGEAYVVLEDNQPVFPEEDFLPASFESYSELDSLGRCQTAYASIGVDLMPTEERGSIGHIKPSGWHTVKYPDLIDGLYLYNRCHLIGYQLAGENANEKNLITGTRYLNVEGMLPFENIVAEYVKETENHVLYRVTPIFSGEELVARGVEMEAISVEDYGEEVCFHVFVYNVQPGIEIDYATGESREAEGN